MEQQRFLASENDILDREMCLVTRRQGKRWPDIERPMRGIVLDRNFVSDVQIEAMDEDQADEMVEHG